MFLTIIAWVLVVYAFYVMIQVWQIAAEIPKVDTVDRRLNVWVCGINYNLQAIGALFMAAMLFWRAG